MNQPLNINFEQLDWQPHPNIPGIDTKMVPNAADFSPSDLLLARVRAHGEIPWHVHPDESEVAYVLQGRGILFSAADAAHTDLAETPMDAGQAVVVPPGAWHSVRNTGAEDMLIFALHTP